MTLTNVVPSSNVLKVFDQTETQGSNRFYRLISLDGQSSAGELIALPGMVWIEPGKFTMGSPPDEAGHAFLEDPVTDVTLTSGYYIGRCEVTQRHWLEFLWLPDRNGSPGQCPAMRKLRMDTLTAESRGCASRDVREFRQAALIGSSKVGQKVVSCGP